MLLHTPADIGAAVRERRRALGWNQAQLAQRTGASRLWIAELESGKPGAGLGLVLRAVAALGLAVNLAAFGSQTASTAIVAPDLDAIIAAARQREPS